MSRKRVLLIWAIILTLVLLMYIYLPYTFGKSPSKFSIVRNTFQILSYTLQTEDSFLCYHLNDLCNSGKIPGQVGSRTHGSTPKTSEIRPTTEIFKETITTTRKQTTTARPKICALDQNLLGKCLCKEICSILMSIFLQIFFSWYGLLLMHWPYSPIEALMALSSQLSDSGILDFKNFT